MEEYLRYLTQRFSTEFYEDSVSSGASTPGRKAKAVPSPTIILVPGMSSVGSVVYEPLIQQLKAYELEGICTVDLPSVDCIATRAVLKPNALQADIIAIRSLLEKAIEDEEKDVVIVAHSYGGTPSLCASEGLWQDARKSSGKQGGVVRAILLSSSLALPGGTVATDRAAWGKEHGGIDDGEAKVEVIEGVSSSNYSAWVKGILTRVLCQEYIIFPDGLKYAWFNGMSDEDRDKWGATLKPASLGGVLSAVPELNPADWKISYLVTKELDFAMPEGFQRHLVNRAQKAGAEVVVKVMESNHFVQITHAEEVAKWIEGICSLMTGAGGG